MSSINVDYKGNRNPHKQPFIDKGVLHLPGSEIKQRYLPLYFAPLRLIIDEVRKSCKMPHVYVPCGVSLIGKCLFEIPNPFMYL